jgi:hypothetical protein
LIQQAWLDIGPSLNFSWRFFKRIDELGAHLNLNY